MWALAFYKLPLNSKCSNFFGKTSIENILLLVFSALHNVDKFSIKLQNLSWVIWRRNLILENIFTTSLPFSQKYGLNVIRKNVGVLSMKLFSEALSFWKMPKSTWSTEL